MSELASPRPASPWPLVAAFGALVALATAVLLPAAQVVGLALLVASGIVAARQRLFAVEGFLCFAAIYYWVGIANPFGADVHDVYVDAPLARELVVLVVLGLGALWAGSRLGGRLAAREAAPKHEGDEARRLERLYRAALVCLGIGATFVVTTYLRLGVPALSATPDATRAEMAGALSPYTQYQWLFVDVGLGLTALVLAQDRAPERRARRARLVLAALGALFAVALYFSRVLVGIPLAMSAVVWWSQGRRIPWRAVTLGGLAVVLLIAVGWLARIGAIGSFTLYGIDFDFGQGLAADLRGVGGALSIFARTSIEVFALFVRGDLPRMHGEVTFMSVIAMLPGKQPDLGLFRITKLMGYEGDTGTTVSLLGGAYADFGAIGIVVAPALLGLAMGWLQGRSERGDRLDGLFYAIVLTYYIAMIYGGIWLDVSLLWKLWLAALAVRYVRTGRLVPTRFAFLQLSATGALIALGALKLAASG